MIKVSELIHELQRFPGDAYCYAYEGEIKGVVIEDDRFVELGYIATSESRNFVSETVFKDNVKNT
ncbi:MAG: hypothetical protein U9P79_06740 [Candidatus Cloacimonadota bacterium]|nr:hypothetical protein [Candidatus Cloacimonadota bacterium]